MSNHKGSIRLEMFGSLIIVGVLLASVSFALITARNRTFDDHIKEVLSSVRASAEIWYSQNNAYETGLDPVDKCDSGTFFTDESVKKYLADLLFPPGSQVECRADQTHYLIQAELSIGQWYCVDNTGFSKSIIVKANSNYNCYQEPVIE